MDEFFWSGAAGFRSGAPLTEHPAGPSRLWEQMAGRIKTLINQLIKKRAAGKPGLEHFVRAHLVLNGINPEEYNEFSDDDPETEMKIEKMIRDFGAQR